MLIEDISSLLSLSDRQKIVLARNLYSDPDIFLLENFFDQLDMDSYDEILEIFNTKLIGKTLVISTSHRNLMRPEDKVLIFNEATAVEYGTLRELQANQKSYLHVWNQSRLGIPEGLAHPNRYVSAHEEKKKRNLLVG